MSLNLFDKLWILLCFYGHGLMFTAYFNHENKSKLLKQADDILFIAILFGLKLTNKILIAATLITIILITILLKINKKCLLTNQDWSQLCKKTTPIAILIYIIKILK